MNNGHWDAVAVAVTDAQGLIAISVDDQGRYLINHSPSAALHSGALYRLHETKAPNGYLMPTAPQYYFFYFTDAPAEELAVYTSAYDLTKRRFAIAVENERKPTSITVEKRWSGITPEA